MVLGSGVMDWNTVSCNESVFIELLHALFFTHNDWVETSFHFIAYVDSISFVSHSSYHCTRHYCFNPLMQAFLILPHCSLLPTFATASISLFIASNITVVIHCCNHLSFCCVIHSWRYSTTRLEAGRTWTTITTSMLSYTTNAYHRISPLPTLHLYPRSSPHHYHLFHDSAHYFTVYYYYLLFIFTLLFPPRLDSDYDYLLHAYIP